ncbi:centromere protein I-like [Diadema antillarum]|uniref:centromere protein I-like n=1 Tax=Diadema antillarum TaxID=105358 RepID=UPI003A8AF856
MAAASSVQESTPTLAGKETPQSRKKLQKAVHFFTDASSNLKVRGNVKLSLALETIVKESQANGLDQTHIIQLADVAASGRLADSTSSRLVKSLIPSVYVPEEAAVQCISWMCTNKPSHDLQALLLKWIILTFDLLDNTEQLHALYGIIFYFIENDTICPHACHLLYLLTRREDVTAYRVRRLLGVQRKVGTQPHITGLLSVYKVFAPHLVSLSLPATQRAYFKLADKAWLAAINGARDRIRARSGGEEGSSFHADLRHSTITETAMVRKRRKLDLVPDFQSTPLTTDREAEVMSKIPIGQIKSFDEFLTNFDRLELPSQAAAVLRSPVLQHLLVCHRNHHTIHRLNFWLSQKLQIELMNSEGDSSRTEQLLQLLINFTDFIQESVPVCEQFLTKYLLTWNGSDYRPYILRLVSRFRIYPFQVLNDLVLEPLRTLFFCSSAYFKCQLLHALTELLRNYATLEIPRYREVARRQREQEEEAVLRGEKEIEGSTSGSSAGMFSTRVDYFDPLETVEKLVDFVEGMCSVALQMDQNHTLIMHHTLAFYEVVSSLYTRYSQPYLVVPSKSLAYRAVFGLDPVACSRLCQILCNYKHEFTALKASADKHQQWDKFKKKIVPFNSIILTLCNCLWRSKAFHPSNDHGVALATAEETGIARPQEMFSMQGGLATVGFCKKFFEETQPSDKQVEPRMIKSAHKTVYMEFLRRERMAGLVNFLETFIRRSSTSTSTTVDRSEPSMASQEVA